MTCESYSPPVSIQAVEADYSPQYGAATEAKSPLRVDPAGNLLVRAQVHGDEGGYRTNFANTSLAVALGTCTFTTGSTTVTGTGFDVSQVHLGDFVYLTADGSTYAVQVGYITPTTLELNSAYLGAGGTGPGSAQVLKEKIGTGGSISVSNGQATITSGTTSSAVMELERDSDYPPITKLGKFSISQRIANQSILYGFYDENGGGTPRWYFWFDYNGTDNTKVNCVCAWNPSTAPSGLEIKTNTVTLPNSVTSAASNDHRIELLKDRVVFLINSQIVWIEYGVVPGPMDFQTSTLRIVNGTSPAGSTSVVIDYDACSNIDIVPTESASQSLAPILQSTASDTIAPQASGAMPSLSYGVQYDPVANVWGRNRGNATQGQLVYSDDMAAILFKLSKTLDAINAKMPPITNLRELPARLTNASSTNIAVGSVAVSANVGSSGTGTVRVTPANDTVAGSPHIYALQTSYTAVRVQQFRDRITT